MIRHVVTSLLRWRFGEDAAPVGLGPALGEAYDLGVTYEEH